MPKDENLELLDLPIGFTRKSLKSERLFLQVFLERQISRQIERAGQSMKHRANKSGRNGYCCTPYSRPNVIGHTMTVPGDRTQTFLDNLVRKYCYLLYSLLLKNRSLGGVSAVSVRAQDRRKVDRGIMKVFRHYSVSNCLSIKTLIANVYRMEWFKDCNSIEID
jgi:hypothetical protein